MSSSFFYRYRQVHFCLVIAVQSLSAYAVDLDISDSPLFVTASMPPNIVLTLDDSGSMEWGYVPDNLNTDQATKRFKSSYFNAIYFNPEVNYTPPPKYNGSNCTLGADNPTTCYPNVSFTAAPRNGFDTSRGTVNLETSYRATLEYNPSSNSQTSTSEAAGPAYYYKFQSTNAGCNGTKTDDDCYTLVNVANAADEVKQNFANWYSYYRTRNLATVSGAMNGFAGLSGSIRVAWQSINSCNSFGTNCDGWGAPGQDLDNRIRRLNAIKRTETTTTVTGTTTTATTYTYTCNAYFNDSASPDRIDLTNCNRTAPSGASNTLPPSSGAGSPENADGRKITVTCANATYCKQYTVDNNGSYRDNSTYKIKVSSQIGNNQTINSVTISWTQTETTQTTTTTTRDITHKEDLYNWLSRFPASGGTYLLKTANNAGKYFQGTVNINHPYAEDPQILDGNHYACRRSVHLMMTDGSWCGDTSADYTGIGDTNSTATSVPSGPDGSTNYSWTPSFPYRDKQATNLADIAFYYWAQDLQTGIDNKLPPLIREPSTSSDQATKKSEEWLNAKNDPATWQHLTTYTVGLGLSGSLGTPYPIWGGSTYEGDYSKLVQGTSCPTSTTSSSSASQYCWPYTANGESCAGYVASTPSKVYDLWHAAISSRGKFYGTESASDLVDAFNSILHEVADESMTAAALAANSTGLQTSTLLYQAQFDPSDWSGHFFAKPVNTSTGVPGTEKWDAASLIPNSTTRKIFTYNGSTGVSFDSCSTISASQKAALDSTDNRCTDRLNWLRGAAVNNFRERKNTVLGDIVNSDPYYVKDINFGFTNLPAKVNNINTGNTNYEAYRSGNLSRIPVVYVGANDGMLHGFRADVDVEEQSGKELFAYIPAGVYSNLSALTSPDYSHRYYVDSGPLASDAYLNGSWQTVLVGGLGKGGKTIYALNVSDPENFGASKVMWEFPYSTNTTTDATIITDLGYTYAQPQIGLLPNGVWAAVFGNGYNSANGKAVLYIVNLSTGSLIKKITTNTETSNGLSTPILYDSDGDKVADTVYAGDLQGNLWKFNLSSSDPEAWGLGNSGLPLFTAINTSSQRQPIATQPAIGGHPDDGVIVYFGTGTYMTVTDAANTNVQSFYGIWDKTTTTGTVQRSALQVQSIITTTTKNGSSVRLTTSNSIDWSAKRGWYIDLSTGERVNSAPILKYDRAIFTTTIPKSDPCQSGGSTWLNEVDLLTGGAPTTPSFDLNNDDKFDDNDKVEIDGIKYIVTGLESTVGIAKAPVWLETNEGTTCKAFKELSGTSGDIMTVKNRCGTTPPSGGGSGTVTRDYWIQIQ